MARIFALSNLCLGLFVAACRGRDVVYDWNITWVSAAPDGFIRPVIGVNGAWPCPPIEASVGDTVIVNVQNSLDNETTGLHFHGINQVRTPEMDGATGTTQCPIPPGSSATYQFVVDAPGTYWWHSHSMGQYPDGLRGHIVVQDPQDPYANQYDEELVLTMSDWYHEQSLDLVRAMLSPKNTLGRPPIPESVIVNEGGDGKFDLDKGKTYRFRIINYASLTPALLHFDGHKVEIIMQDGSYVKKDSADQLLITPAQRYDVLLHVAEDDVGNYPYLVTLNTNHGSDEPVWPLNFTGHLILERGGELKQTVVDEWHPKDDMTLNPLQSSSILGPVGSPFVLDFDPCPDKYGIPRLCFNKKSYLFQPVPALYTAATTGEDNTNPLIYGQVNPFIASYGDVVQLVVNNRDHAAHPFHLHGHQFQVLERPRANTGDWAGSEAGFRKNPTTKDTILVNERSYAVLRFKADNPGVFLFHCHIEWHVEMGLTATIIEAPEKLRNMTFPEDHIKNCKLMGMSYEGNAGGNVVDVLDTSNFVTEQEPTYNGALWPLPTTSEPSIDQPTKAAGEPSGKPPQKTHASGGGSQNGHQNGHQNGEGVGSSHTTIKAPKKTKLCKHSSSTPHATQAAESHSPEAVQPTPAPASPPADTHQDGQDSSDHSQDDHSQDDHSQDGQKSGQDQGKPEDQQQPGAGQGTQDIGSHSSDNHQDGHDSHEDSQSNDPKDQAHDPNGYSQRKQQTSKDTGSHQWEESHQGGQSQDQSQSQAQGQGQTQPQAQQPPNGRQNGWGHRRFRSH